MARTKEEREERRKQNKALKEQAKLEEESIKRQIEWEKERQKREDKKFRGLAGLISLTIAMGQATQNLIGDSCERFASVFNPTTNRMRNEQKAALKFTDKNLKTAFSSLYKFQDLQEEFTSSNVINTQQRMILGEAQLKHYREIAELCSLYLNAENSNPDIMKLVHPIFLGQTKVDDVIIPDIVMQKYRQ